MKTYMILIFSLLCVGFLQAQSGEMMDQFLAGEFADTGTTLLLIAQAADELGTESTPEDALLWASERKWGSRFSESKPEDSISSGKFYLALLESFSLKGGVFYSLFKSPRLAAKEAEYQGISTGIPYANHIMTPLEVFSAISAVLEIQESAE